MSAGARAAPISRYAAGGGPKPSARTCSTRISPGRSSPIWSAAPRPPRAPACPRSGSTRSPPSTRAVYKFSTVSLWLRPAIEAFKEGWDRTPGRPRKTERNPMTYGTLTDYATGEVIRPATRQEWEFTAKAIDDGKPEGIFRDGERTVYVDGGPDPVVGDQAIRDFQDEAGRFGDQEQVAICGRALDGDGEARAECAELMGDYRCREAEALT